MHFLKLICIYLCAIIICILLFSINISPVFIFLILFGFVFSFTVLPFVNIMHWTKDIKKIDYFLHNNRQKLLFHYVYALAHEPKETQHMLLKKMSELTNGPNVLHAYRSQLAVLNKNYELALYEAAQIKNSDLRNYTIAQIEISRGHIDEAQFLRTSLKKSWMPYALDAQIAYESCQFDSYKKNSTLAIENSRGLQRYTLSHSFRQYI